MGHYAAQECIFEDCQDMITGTEVEEVMEQKIHAIKAENRDAPTTAMQSILLLYYTVIGSDITKAMIKKVKVHSTLVKIRDQHKY